MDTKQYLKYVNYWVAIDERTKKIVLASKTLKALYKNIRQQKLSNVVVHYLTPADRSLAPYVGS